MHLGALRLSSRNLHIQRPHRLSQALTSWLSCDRKNNWRWLQTIQCQLIVPGRSCQDQTSREGLGPLVLIFPSVGGRMVGVGLREPSPFPPPNWTLPVRRHRPGSPHSQPPETSDEGKRGHLCCFSLFLPLENKSCVLFYCGRNT